MIIYTDAQLRHKNKFKCKQKAASANKRFEDKITDGDVLRVLERFGFRCFYCGNQLDFKTWQLDHFHSRAMGGKNVSENIVCACKWCNVMKHALDGHSFIKHAQRIVSNNLIKDLPKINVDSFTGNGIHCDYCNVSHYRIVERKGNNTALCNNCNRYLKDLKK